MEYPRSTKDHQQVSNNREAMHQFFLASKEWQLLSPEESEMGREPRSVSVYCRNTELRLRVTSQYRCTGNADSLNRIAMACRWGVHKYGGVAHFVDIADSIGIRGSRLTARNRKPS